MRILGALVLLPLTLCGQIPPNAALMRGVLLERDTQTAKGQFSIRAADNEVLRYQFDSKTYVEREDRLIDVSRLLPGEKVEVLSDTVPGSAVRYARTVHVIPDPPPPRPLSAGRVRAYRRAEEHVIPTGNLTFSGVVFRVNGERLILHVHESADQTILLRKDTRYLQNGEIVEAETLKPNMRVFIRAGKDLYDQVEAYQVIWGKILDPK
jgi:hypothetical protein